MATTQDHSGPGVGIINFDVADADTEYEMTIPKGTKTLHLRPADAVSCRLSFTAGLVATPTRPYISFSQSAPFSMSFPGPLKSDTTLYLAGGSGVIVEAVCQQEK